MTNSKEPFSDPRWTQPIGGEVVGHVERSEEESAQDKKRFRDHLKKIGVIKDEAPSE